LVANTECPEDFIAWLDVLQPKKLDGSNDFFVEVAVYLHKVSTVCTRIRHVMYNEIPELSVSAALDLLAEAGAVDASCQISSNLCDGNETTKPEDGVFSTLYIQNIYRTARCKMYHFMTLLLNQVLPFAYPLDNQLLIQQWNLDCQLIVRDMINDILEVAPFGKDQLVDELPGLSGQKIQCWADALRLVWPLTVVTWLAEALPEQRDLAHESLRQIGKKLGIKQAWIEGTSTRLLMTLPKRIEDLN